MTCRLAYFIVACTAIILYAESTFSFPEVSLMAATPQELHINIEEKPLLETQVQYAQLSCGII